jgi:hypothetical protein
MDLFLQIGFLSNRIEKSVLEHLQQLGMINAL